ncbi:STAS domain-containing protein [Actinosynnema sp. NPDC059797]
MHWYHDQVVPFDSHVLRRGHLSVVRPSGEIDIAVVDELMFDLSRALAGGTRALVVDLSGVTFLSAGGIGALARARAQAEARGCDFALAACSRAALRVLNAIRPHLTFDLRATVDLDPGGVEDERRDPRAAVRLA